MVVVLECGTSESKRIGYVGNHNVNCKTIAGMVQGERGMPRGMPRSAGSQIENGREMISGAISFHKRI